jgi:hypothetical protein
VYVRNTSKKTFAGMGISCRRPRSCSSVNGWKVCESRLTYSGNVEKGHCLVDVRVLVYNDVGDNFIDDSEEADGSLAIERDLDIADAVGVAFDLLEVWHPTSGK